MELVEDFPILGAFTLPIEALELWGLDFGILRNYILFGFMELRGILRGRGEIGD